MNDYQKKLVILTGPTAVGKTAISIKLAKMLSGEIISADSMQVYRGMDIGSAKITPDEMQGIKHYLIDILNPNQDFNVAMFKDLAKNAAMDINSRGKIPIVTGGTGFYINALLYDNEFTETTYDGYRDALNRLYEEKGGGYLYDLLIKEDPESAKVIHQNNIKRVIRALEYKHQTGQCISEHNSIAKAKPSPYNFAYFVLTMDRQALYERIDKRIDIMLENGLVDEIKRLDQTYKLDYNMTSMQGLGYKEIFAYLKNECTLDEAVYKLKRDTRHFAKRQLTWFKGRNDVTWVDKDVHKTEEEQLAFMTKVLLKKGILSNEQVKGILP